MFICVRNAITLEAIENLPLINSDWELLLQLLAIKEDTQFFQLVSGSVWGDQALLEIKTLFGVIQKGSDILKGLINDRTGTIGFFLASLRRPKVASTSSEEKSLAQVKKVVYFGLKIRYVSEEQSGIFPEKIFLRVIPSFLPPRRPCMTKKEIARSSMKCWIKCL